MRSTLPGATPTPDDFSPGTPDSPAESSRLLYEPQTRDFRRYVFTYGVAALAISLLWGAVLSVLLPLQVQSLQLQQVFGAGSGVDLDALNALSQRVASGEVTPTLEQQQQLQLLARFNSARASSLSLVTSVGVLVAMLMQPVIGTISDRTRSRWGRRAPYVAGGVLAGAVVLCVMPHVPTIGALVVVWSLVQLFGNLAQGPLTATVADRVPEKRLATVSAISGLMVYAAAIVGALAAGALFNVIGLASYYPFAAALVLLAVPFLLVAKDRSSRTLPVERVRVGTILVSFVAALRDRDYRWAWISKVLLWMGFGISTAYGIYMLQSYVRPALTVAEAASTGPLLQTAALPGTLLGMAIAGRLSDRWGRRKPFVIFAAAIIAVGFVVPWVWPTLPAMFIQAALSGVGLGAFLVVDQALFIDLLPDPAAAGRDLGMSALGQNLGQALGPAVAGLVVSLAGGSYGPVWPVGFAIVLVSTLTILPIRRVR